MVAGLDADEPSPEDLAAPSLSVRLRRLLVPIARIALLVDAFLVEPNWIEVRRWTVPAQVARPVRVAHLSDLHTHGLGLLERRLVGHLSHEKPGLIVVTGDVATPGGTAEGYREVLGSLHAPLRIWMVPGNWERDGARMYVTRGLGTSIAPARLFCRPERAVIQLTPDR